MSDIQLSPYPAMELLHGNNSRFLAREILSAEAARSRPVMAVEG
jgi:hypothetical protein